MLVAALVADAIGILPTILALALCSALGAMIAVGAGRDALVRISDRVAHGEMPGDELIDGAVVFVAGMLLVVPGFIGAAVGLVLLVPITRARVRGIARRRIGRRLGFSGRRRDLPPEDVIDL